MGAKACDEKGGLALSIASPHLGSIQRLSVSKACKSSCIGHAKALLQEDFHDSLCPKRPCIATGLRPHLLHLLGPFPNSELPGAPRLGAGRMSSTLVYMEGAPDILLAQDMKHRAKWVIQHIFVFRGRRQQKYN